MNTSTTLTLNDRFSMMKSNGFVAQTQPQVVRGRSRSRSRGRPQQQNRGANLRGSQRNQKLLTQLEKQHKLRLATKLKNKSILTSRGRVQGQIIRGNVRRAANIKKAVNVRNLKRSNSLTTFVPLNDGPGRNMRGRSRSRSRSRNRSQQAGSITDRLGVRQPRKMMRRGQANGAKPQQQQQQRSRSRSRVRLNRNNFNNGNNRNVNNGNNRNANNNRSASRNRNASQIRNASQKRNASNVRNGNNQAKPRRANSVNARLGNSGPNNQIRRRRIASTTRKPNAQLKKPLGGRIVKRTQKAPVGARVQRNVRANGTKALGAGANARRGKIVKRGGINQGPTRGRVQNRGGLNNQGGQGAAARRGRSRTRRGANNSRGGGGGGAGRGGIARGQVSKAQLDKQLDDYMSKGSA